MTARMLPTACRVFCTASSTCLVRSSLASLLVARADYRLSCAMAAFSAAEAAALRARMTLPRSAICTASAAAWLAFRSL